MWTGRILRHGCTDGKRCKICRSEGCSHDELHERLACYHTTGVKGLYIRRHQVDYMDLCLNPEEKCFFKMDNKGVVTRGCIDGGTKETGVELCGDHLCNRQMAAIYCFTCQTTDPNCVFSQHEGPFELCPPPNIGCYTRIYKDNSVERGCAKERNQNVTAGDSFIFCNEGGLCNGKTTKYHSCNHLQLNLNFGPNIPVPQEYWQKTQEQGWLFESCPDTEGLPPCYLKNEYKMLIYGCTRDLTDYELVTYERGSMIPELNLCGGHYCNALPELKDPKWRD